MSLRISLMPTGVTPFLSAAATNCAPIMASPTIWRAIVSSQPAARDGDAPANRAHASTIDPKILGFCMRIQLLWLKSMILDFTGIVVIARSDSDEAISLSAKILDYFAFARNDDSATS